MYLKPILFVLSSSPFLIGLWAVFFQPDYLGANPVETLLHSTGDWTLRFLILTLAMNPFNRLGWRRALSFRRMFGLFSFFYAVWHVLIWLIFDRQLDWIEIGEDILKRPYIIVGLIAFIILFALAITSNKISMLYLGSRWKILHRWVYIAALLAIVHYLWLVKADKTDPLFYLSLFLILMIMRYKRIR